MNIGIVTTWFERGAAYVSRQYMEVLQKEYNVFIYARSGESYAKGNKEWDLPNVYWSKKINSPFTVTVMDKKEFTNWVKKNRIEAVLFNEQHWWEPLLWCDELKVKTIAYIDYYTEHTVPLYGIYDMLICNTKKHLEAFSWHKGAIYIPWGTDIDLFKPVNKKNMNENKVIFFHSCGMAPKRKGTDLLIKAIPLIDNHNFKVIIHSQIDLNEFYPELSEQICSYITDGRLEIIHKTVQAPGLYTKGDIYVYPSRLEGIGLTIAEAISSGLGIIVPDCGPMNEFVKEDFGCVVKVDKYFSRHDGYYWPQNEVSIQSLAEAMGYYINNKGVLNKVCSNARNYALKSLDWNKNSQEINIVINELISNNLTRSKRIEISKIKEFEKLGLRKYNKYYLKYPMVFDFIRGF